MYRSLYMYLLIFYCTLLCYSRLQSTHEEGNNRQKALLVLCLHDLYYYPEDRSSTFEQR
jgi:hypothetical protein